MSERTCPRRLPGPKTLLRTGAFLSPGGVGRTDGAPDEEARDRGVAIRRALVDEIRVQAAASLRRKRQR